MTSHNPVITNALPSWVFIQRTAYSDERHEIREVPSGFMIFFNVCDATGGGCSTSVIYLSYCAAYEDLIRFRPGSKLVERINGAGAPGTL